MTTDILCKTCGNLITEENDLPFDSDKCFDCTWNSVKEINETEEDTEQ